MDFRNSLEKNKKKYKALPLSCAPVRDSRGPAQLLGRAATGATSKAYRGNTPSRTGGNPELDPCPLASVARWVEPLTSGARPQVIVFVFLPHARLAEGAESPDDDCRCYGAPLATLWLWMSSASSAASIRVCHGCRGWSRRWRLGCRRTVASGEIGHGATVRPRTRERAWELRLAQGSLLVERGEGEELGLG